jgi:hypothetical protein
VIRSIIAVATTLVISAGSAEAYQTIGPGMASCATWIADRREPSMHQLEQAWVLGFLSGVGYMGAPNLDPLQRVDAAAVAAWIDDYCQRHPLEEIVGAAEAFLKAHPH